MPANQQEKPSLETVNKDLEALKRSRETSGKEEAKLTPSAGAAKGAISFLSMTAVMSLLGFAVDHFAHTMPWGTLVGLLIGAVLGLKIMLNDVKQGN